MKLPPPLTSASRGSRRSIKGPRVDRASSPGSRWESFRARPDRSRMESLRREPARLAGNTRGLREAHLQRRHCSRGRLRTIAPGIRIAGKRLPVRPIFLSCRRIAVLLVYL